MGTTSNVLKGVAAIKWGTAGSAATTDIGYTQDGAEISLSEDVSEIEVDQETWPIDEDTTKQGGTVTVNVAEATLDNLAKVTGGTVTEGVLTLGTRGMISLAVVGKSPAGTSRTWDFLNVKPSGEIKYAYKKGQAQVIPVTFKVFKRGNDEPVKITDAPVEPEG